MFISKNIMTDMDITFIMEGMDIMNIRYTQELEQAVLLFLLYAAVLLLEFVASWFG